MTEDLVTFETAQLAKEKGCIIETSQRMMPYYRTNKKQGSCEFNSLQGIDCRNPKIIDCFAYTQALLQKWLRKKHGINITISMGNELQGMMPFYPWDSFEELEDKDSVKYAYILHNAKGESDMSQNKFDKYEDALEEGLQQALKLIKS
jgi:hypothetical protein